jgi:hypothetical protein
MKKNEDANAIYRLSAWFFIIWLAMWFGCIWIAGIRIELFATGLLSFVLAIWFHTVAEKVEEGLK